MNRLLIAILLLLLAALLYHCLLVRPAQIESDVLACVQGRMTDAGLDDVGIAVDGRDVLLIGTAPDEQTKRRAGDIAGEDCGARVIANELTIVPPAPYRTKLCIDRQGLSVEGAVPDAEAERRYLALTAERLGAVVVETDTIVRADPPAGYGRLVTTALAELGQLEHGCIDLAGREVRVTGAVRSAAARDRLVGSLDRAAGEDFRVAYDLSVPRLSESALACQEALDTLIAPGEQVLFDFDSTELHAEGRELLDEAEAVWETCPGLSLIVAGHTDAEGDAEYNRALSQRRADVVVEYLVDQGFDPGKLTPIGYGEAQPQASNETEEGRALNRRMEFRVRETAQ